MANNEHLSTSDVRLLLLAFPLLYVVVTILLNTILYAHLVHERNTK